MKNGINSVAAELRLAATRKIEILATSQILSNLKNKTRLAAKSSAPFFAAILLNLIISEAARAQGGGPIFSGNANNLANIVREGLKLFAILLFCGGAAFAFGTIIAVIYSIAQGQNVAVDTNF